MYIYTLQGSFYSISHEYQKKVSSVGCQEIEFRIYDPPGSGEVMEAASRLADTVLLCYRASDVTSLKTVADKVSLKCKLIVYNNTEHFKSSFLFFVD